MKVVYVSTMIGWVMTVVFAFIRVGHKIIGIIPSIEFKTMHQGWVELTVIMTAISVICLLSGNLSKEAKSKKGIQDEN